MFNMGGKLRASLNKILAKFNIKLQKAESDNPKGCGEIATSFPDGTVKNNVVKSLPSIAIITIPKSGTVYMRGLLQKGLPIAYEYYADGYFPYFMIYPRAMEKFSKGGYINFSHTSPIHFNIECLRKNLQRWVVHLRDPRSVMVSWIHHIEQQRKIFNSNQIYYKPIFYDSTYFNLSFDDKVSRNIDLFLPYAVRWINQWLEIIDKKRGGIYY